MSVRLVLYALVVIVAGAFLFLVGAGSEVELLASEECSPDLNYLGCETPAAQLKNNDVAGIEHGAGEWLSDYVAGSLSSNATGRQEFDARVL